jgi:hypothetical protein
MVKEKPTAVLTIHRPGQMATHKRQSIAAWLRRQASHFLRYGKSYSETRFTSRLY